MMRLFCQLAKKSPCGDMGDGANVNRATVIFNLLFHYSQDACHCQALDIQEQQPLNFNIFVVLLQQMPR